MKKTWKPILSLLLALCITVSTAAGAIAIGRASAADGAANWLLKMCRRSGGSGAGTTSWIGRLSPLQEAVTKLMGDYLQYIDGVVRANFSLALFKRLCAYRAGGCRGGRRCPQCGRA